MKEITIEPLDGSLCCAGIIICDGSLSFGLTAFSIFEQPDFGFVQFLVDLIEANRNSS